MDLLISTEELAARLDDPEVVVIDVRYGLDDRDEGRRAHAEAHIPGATYLHWLDDWSDPDDAVEGQLAPPERFAEAMRRAGVDDDTLVVAYDDAELFMAARLVWALRVYRHPRAQVLDGGFPKWQREGRPVRSGPSTPTRRGTFSVRPADPTLRLEKADMLARVERGDDVVLDCRMDRTWEESGQHIPGAARLPSPSLVRDDGTLRPAEELVEIATASGAQPDAPVSLYCGGGVSAAQGWLALTTAGFTDVKVYDGSWSEWSADPATPKAVHAPGGGGPIEPR